MTGDMQEKLSRSKEGKDRLEVWRKFAEDFLDTHPSMESCLSVVRDTSNRKLFRVLGLMTAVAHLTGTRKLLRSSLQKKYDFSAFPVNPQLYKLEEKPKGTGYWSEVYMLEPKQDGLPRLVFKVEFPSKTHSVEDLMNVVLQHRDEHALLKEAYAELPNLIPETNYLISESPRTQKPAIAALQTYAGDEPFDLLNPKFEGKLQDLVRTDKRFAKYVATFYDITAQLEEKKKAPDIAGDGNVLVVRVGDVHELRLVDHHSFGEDNVGAKRTQARKLAYLKRLRDTL